MKFLNHTFPSPEENLACDEALLDLGEEAGGGAILRCWEPRQPFVVVGYANRVSAETDVPACQAHGVPVLRRCSGGGTVLQAPGCLNYALILRVVAGGPLDTITGANRFIMRRNAEAVAAAIGRPVQVQGHTDLTLDGRKFSGNSQRRKRACLLFHGCFLLDLDLALVARCLRMPSRQPEYRRDRAHADFLVNLGVNAAEVKSALRRAWRAEVTLADPPRERVTRLAREKYATPEWNWKWDADQFFP